MKTASHLSVRGDGHPRSRPIHTPDGRFGSAELAADYYGISAVTIRRKVRARVEGWSYDLDSIGARSSLPDPDGSTSQDRRTSTHLMKKVVAPHGLYPSLKAAAAAYGVSIPTIVARIERGADGWSFAGEEDEGVPAGPEDAHTVADDEIRRDMARPIGFRGGSRRGSEGHHRRIALACQDTWRDKNAAGDENLLADRVKGHGNRRPVNTPDGSFESMSLAAEAFGISVPTVGNRIRRGEEGWSFRTSEDCPIIED